HHADACEDRACGEPYPGDRARDRAGPEADRQANESEEAQEAKRDQSADSQSLDDPRRRRGQPLLVGAEIEREKGGQERKAAWVYNREPAGDQGKRDRDGVDQELLTQRFIEAM